MAASSDESLILEAFEDAIKSFKADLGHDGLYREMTRVKTVDELYNATDEIQKQQGRGNGLRNTAAIKPYVKRLIDYAPSIEAFTKKKPEILSPIWGPIAALLRRAMRCDAIFDAVVGAMKELGEHLPDFKQPPGVTYSGQGLLNHNHAISLLFFRDIILFHLVLSRSFTDPLAENLFEFTWPTTWSKMITIISTHVKSHARLIGNDFPLGRVQQEHWALQQALREFEEEQRKRDNQEFHRIKMAMTPETQDERRNLLTHSAYTVSGDWLLEDAAFKEWSAFAFHGPKILWLQGMLGSGKTYLANDVLKKLQSIDSTGFAFLSHKYRSSTTAISVIHALTFSLAYGTTKIPAVVSRSFNEECKTSLKAATELLMKVLGCVFSAFLLVDGLDEMEESQRGRLASELFRISKEFESRGESNYNVRLFITSRKERGLVSIFNEDTTVIRIGRRNVPCIREFIKKWTQTWFAERRFRPEEEAEIESSLERRAPGIRAQVGVFLEARMLLDSIKILDKFKDIRKELKYGTIGSWNDTEEACLILGWIGCSPKPLTVQEIQQLLAIDLEAPDKLGEVRGELDVVQICGPVVEVVDGYVQFIHWMVQEDIFDPSAAGSISLPAATLDLALRCVTYLCQDHHSPNLSDEQVNENTLAGTYTLDWIATNMWPHIVKHYLRSINEDKSLSQLGWRLHILYSTRLRKQLPKHERINDLAVDSYTFKETFPEAHALVGQALRFREMCTASDHVISREASWSGLDPLTTSELSLRIQSAIDHYLLDKTPGAGDSNRRLLRQWYGQRPYKCQYLSCPFNRTGFPDEAQRLSHMKHHDRPYKCSIPACEFSQRGFLSEKMRDDHSAKVHPTPERQYPPPKPLPDHASCSANILSVLVGAGLVDIVARLLPREAESDSDPVYDDTWKNRTFTKAVESGSLPMVKFYASKFKAALPKRIELPLWAAVRIRNVEILEYLLTWVSENGEDMEDFVLGMEKAIKYKDYDTIDVFANFIKARPWNQVEGNDPYALREALWDKGLIEATWHEGDCEIPLLDLWRSIRWGKSATEEAKTLYFSELLLTVAQTTRSAALAEFLIKAGADPNYRPGPQFCSPLDYAGQGRGHYARELTECLLEYGADGTIAGPSVVPSRLKPRRTRREL